MVPFKTRGVLGGQSAFACTVLFVVAAVAFLWGQSVSVGTLNSVTFVAALLLVGFLYWTSRIPLWLAFPLVVAAIALFASVQSAQANTKVRWSMYDGTCYRYSVTEYRYGLTFGFNGNLWSLNQRLDWCSVGWGGRVWSGPVVHRSHAENAWWDFTEYQAKTSVHKLLNPTRWQVYVKAKFSAKPDLWGITEHNYPWIRMTIWKANPSHVHYDASCGCG